MNVPVYLEIGQKRVFACALDWPGWCRLGKDEEQALAALALYAERYAIVAAEAGLTFSANPEPHFEIVERLPGSGTTDFGAPGKVASSDRESFPAEEAKRIAALVEAAWRIFDVVVNRAPAELAKGPRGGGRDRDKIVEHVLAAETAYARTIGVRQKQPEAKATSDILALRQALLDGLRAGSEATSPVEKGWPLRYAARRIAWHVLDHAWEIEDKSI